MKFYRMNVDWGQRPIAEVEFDKKQTDKYRGGEIHIASPRRTLTSSPWSETLDEDVPVTARAVGTPYVFYRNREENVAHQEASDAGQWYVMVTLDGGKDNGMQAKDIEFRLSTALEGNKVDGPEWRQTLEPGPEPTPEPPGTNDEGNGGQENNGNSSDDSNAPVHRPGSPGPHSDRRRSGLLHRRTPQVAPTVTAAAAATAAAATVAASNGTKRKASPKHWRGFVRVLGLLSPDQGDPVPHLYEKENAFHAGQSFVS